MNEYVLIQNDSGCCPDGAHISPDHQEFMGSLSASSTLKLENMYRMFLFLFKHLVPNALIVISHELQKKQIKEGRKLDAMVRKFCSFTLALKIASYQACMSTYKCFRRAKKLDHYYDVNQMTRKQLIRSSTPKHSPPFFFLVLLSSVHRAL